MPKLTVVFVLCFQLVSYALPTIGVTARPPVIRRRLVSCSDCDVPDECDCGYCGSFDQCTWSCNNPNEAVADRPPRGELCERGPPYPPLNGETEVAVVRVARARLRVVPQMARWPRTSDGQRAADSTLSPLPSAALPHRRRGCHSTISRQNLNRGFLPRTLCF